MNALHEQARIGLISLLCLLTACTNSKRGESGAMGTKDAQRANRLAHATSPYLLQHAYNPVDWHEWGEDAFAKAKRENKPIFLSIGYAACHWCHVMAHESFENDAIAAILNRHFVCIKVDREERPDVDEIYMQATLAMNNGQGGWPMTVFLTPDRRPFFAGTYFPPEGFRRLAEVIADAWKDRPGELIEQSGKVQEYLQSWATVPAGGEHGLGVEEVVSTARELVRYIDPGLGGFQTNANKFPPSMAMELMLRAWRRTGDEGLMRAVRVTLDHMARGGIYDHLGGGICRYSTDPQWLVPHFEKMLYDQALVSGIYLDAYQATGEPLYAETAAGILDYVLEDLQAPDGGFYSSRDADSEGLEGKYYVWTVAQVQEVLGEADAKLFCDYYDVTEGGNWFESLGHAPSGPKSILNIRRPLNIFAELHGLDMADLQHRLADMRAKLRDARATRVAPALDDKILTAWNGLAIASLARGAVVLDEPRYAEAAARAADFVLVHLQEDGRLLRTWRQGRGRLTGYLSDYAFFIEGLLNLYEATFDLRWLEVADALAEQSVRHYFDETGGAFFFTADDAEALIARTKNPRDGAIPSGNSVHAQNLLRLAILLDKPAYREKAESIFRAFASMATESPGAFERLLSAADFSAGPIQEVALVGPVADPSTRELLRAVHRTFRPNKVLALSAGPESDAARRIPLLAAKTMQEGRATVYVCRNYTCRRPVTMPADLETILDAEK